MRRNTSLPVPHGLSVSHNFSANRNSTGASKNSLYSLHTIGNEPCLTASFCSGISSMFPVYSSLWAIPNTEEPGLQRLINNEIVPKWLLMIPILHSETISILYRALPHSWNVTFLWHHQKIVTFSLETWESSLLNYRVCERVSRCGSDSVTAAAIRQENMAWRSWTERKNVINSWRHRAAPSSASLW